MSALSKIEIVDALMTEFNINRKEGQQVVELFFDSIADIISKHQDVRLSGFGNFVVRSKRERPGRNPRTGQPVVVTARHVVSFKAGSKLKLLMIP